MKKYINLHCFIKQLDCITDLKQKKMKKLVFMFVAIAAMSLASCGNKKADAEKAKADSIRIADSIAAVEAAAAAAAEEAAADTVAVIEEEVVVAE